MYKSKIIKFIVFIYKFMKILCKREINKIE